MNYLHLAGIVLFSSTSAASRELSFHLVRSKQAQAWSEPQPIPAPCMRSCK